MKFKNLILVVSFFFAGVSCADDYYLVQQYRGIINTQTRTLTYSNISFEQACKRTLDYCLVSFNTNTCAFSLAHADIGGFATYAVSNITTGAYTVYTQNPEYLYAMNFLNALEKVLRVQHIDLFKLGVFKTGTTYGYFNGNLYYPRDFNFHAFESSIYNYIDVSFLSRELSTLHIIQTDVSSLVPALESHAANVSNLAQIVSSATGVSTNLQHDIYNKLYGIHYALNEYPGLSGIYDKLELLDPTTASPYWLGQAFAAAYGMETYPEQALVSAGLASNFQDAQNKLADPNWCHKILAPAIQSQKRKNAYIQQFQQDGLTPPPGKTWDQLSENELETIANYSYNTPVSSNATLKAHALDYLKHIQDSNDSIDSSLNDLRQHIQGGPLEVNVMNWPDDLFNLGGISNIFADLTADFQNALTNFNPHYTWEDALFFNRSQYSWRGLNTLDFDPRQDPNRSAIGVSTFNFTPTGNYFQDVPNFLALQSRISVDIANMIATVTAYSQTNLADRASTADLEQQYQEEFLQQSAEALNEFEQSQSYSNLLARNTRFIDTSSVFSTPSGFTEIFSGNHSIPTHINLQLPSWHFGQDDQSTPDVGSTITIETAQYATFFQNCRYVFLFLYWGMTVMIMIWLFRLFSRFISWIPLSLTGGGSHDTVSI